MKRAWLHVDEHGATLLVYVEHVTVDTGARVMPWNEPRVRLDISRSDNVGRIELTCAEARSLARVLDELASIETSDDDRLDDYASDPF